MEKVLFMVLAHNKLADRSDAVMAAIREMLAAEGSGMSCMCPGGAGRGVRAPKRAPRDLLRKALLLLSRYVPDMRLEDDMAGAVQEKIVELSQLPSSAAVAGDSWSWVV